MLGNVVVNVKFLMKPESKFWQEVKKNITGISFTRLESWASAGVPDSIMLQQEW